MTVDENEGEVATTQTPVFSSDTVVIVAAGSAFAFAMLGWLAGHRISLALPPEVATRAMVPLMVGVAGLFLGAGLGLLLGDLTRADRRGTVHTDRSETVVVDRQGTVLDDRRRTAHAGRRPAGAIRALPSARAPLAVGVLLLLVTAWMIKPPEFDEPPAPAGTTTAPTVETGTVSPTVLPTTTG